MIDICVFLILFGRLLLAIWKVEVRPSTLPDVFSLGTLEAGGRRDVMTSHLP